MEELHSWVENNIKIIKCLIERNKKYFDYPFTSNTAHYYKLMLLHKEMECLMSFNDFLQGLGLHRGQLKDKKSSHLKR